MKVKGVFENLEYGPAPESISISNEWLDSYDRRFGCYIAGNWVQCKTTFATFEPSNGTELAQISQAGESEVNAAVKAAQAALSDWQEIGGAGRAKLLYALGRQIQKHSRLFAVLESRDNGKPIRETRTIDIPLVSRHFTYHAGWASLMESEFSGYQAVGVCGQIIPWNFPLLMLAWKIAPALAMGNTVVLKPAEFTNLSALLFAQICDEVGIPAGVVNIVTGDGETGKLIVNHPGIQKLAFTGSTEVGRILRRATAGTGKKLSLELGGKSPFIIFEDADLDSAVEGLVDAIWFNQGQVCCAGSRLLVQEGIAERAYAKIRARMNKLRVGDPLDKAVDLGAIVDKVQLDRIDALVKQGVKEGATCFQTECKFPPSGWFYPPTLLTDVGPASTVVQEEIFGPVLVAMTFRTPKEAVELANNTVYGLAASVWTENINVAHDTASQLKAGVVWINCTNQFDAAAGFGGYRESGFGREGGREGLYEYIKLAPPEIKLSSHSITNGEPVAGELDITHKQFIGGKQERPDSGYSLSYRTTKGVHSVAMGNRKDLRNAVEAALGAEGSWSKSTGYLRSQILYYLAENAQSQADALIDSLMLTGFEKKAAQQEVDTGIARIFEFAGWADKFDGQVHETPLRSVTYTKNEALGAVGIVCPNHQPFSGFATLCSAALSMGNCIVVVPSEAHPFAAAEFYRVIEASDIPAGVWNIVTGQQSELERTLAEHDGLASLWHFGSESGSTLIEELSAGNLKQTWTFGGKSINTSELNAKEILRHATQVKNIWTPFGA